MVKTEEGEDWTPAHAKLILAAIRSSRGCSLPGGDHAGNCRSRAHGGCDGFGFRSERSIAYTFFIPEMSEAKRQLLGVGGGSRQMRERARSGTNGEWTEKRYTTNTRSSDSNETMKDVRLHRGYGNGGNEWRV
jgi:hypothetical protein